MSNSFDNQQKNYNKKNYLKIRKKKKSIGVTGPEFIELIHCGAGLYATLAWETREEIFELLDQFIEKKIAIFQFCRKFTERGELTTNACEALEENEIILPTYQKWVDFSELLEDIHEYCEQASRDGLDENSTSNNPLTSVEFRKAIKKFYNQLQKFRDD